MDDKPAALFPIWQPHPKSSDRWPCEILAKPNPQGEGDILAYLEDFGYACYPSALNSVSGQWERHGPARDRIAGKLWAERVAGLHPAKPGDECPPFYYHSSCKAYSETVPADRLHFSLGETFYCLRCDLSWSNLPAVHWRPAGCLDRVR